MSARKILTPEQKVAILREHLIEKVPVSQVCDKNGAATVYWILSDAGLLKPNNQRSPKGTGFQQPLLTHEHWHIHISYLNIAGAFYFMATIPDGFSRSIVHWDIREKMEELDTEIILQAGREKYPGVTPRIIPDNGPQFIAKDFKHFIRLHSAIGYVTPLAMLEDRQQAIFDERDRKLEEARELRARTRAAKSSGKSKDPLSNQDPTAYLNSVVAEDRALPGCLPSAAAMPLTEACAGRI